MTGRPGLLAALIGSLLPLAATAVAVAAASSAPVVLLGTAEDEPLTGRIAAELRALGIAIDIRVVSGDARGVEVEVESALREGARAAVRIDGQTGRTEVSIPDATTRQVALKQVLEGPPTAALLPVLAVRTVEFVRATLLGPRSNDARRAGGGAGGGDLSNTDGAIAGGPGDVDDDGPSIAGLSGLGLTLDSGGLITPGGLAPQVAVGIALRLRLLPRVGVELMGNAPLSQARVDAGSELPGAQGSASTWLVGAGLFVRQPVGRRAGVEGGAGVLMALLSTSGLIQGVEKSDLSLGASIYARFGANLALTRNLALRLDLLGGPTFRRVVTTFATTPDQNSPVIPRVAWGSSFAAALAGFEARWF